jgi:hypothetical protein
MEEQKEREREREFRLKAYYTRIYLLHLSARISSTLILAQHITVHSFGLQCPPRVSTLSAPSFSADRQDAEQLVRPFEQLSAIFFSLCGQLALGSTSHQPLEAPKRRCGLQYRFKKVRQDVILTSQ